MKETNKMKKLMIVAAVALAAVCSQAAQFKWVANGIKDGYNSGNPGYEAANATGTAYLIFVTQVAQDTMVANILDGTTTKSDVAGLAKSQATLNNGAAVVMTSFDYDTPIAVGQKETAYVVLFSPDEKYVYVSPTAQADVLQSGASQFPFGTQSNSNTIGTTVGTWQSVPEPTSGLLLLLGVAGLALRRRRA